MESNQQHGQEGTDLCKQMFEENLEDQMGRQDKEQRSMGKSRTGAYGRTVGKAKMEMDRTYITETTKQYH